MAQVLIGEDDPEIAYLLERYFKRAGHQVFHAADGQAALDIFADHRIDVVLMDALLPKRNGFDVVAEMRARQSADPLSIIMMSASFRGPTASKDALARGADYFFPKPFALADLQRQVDSLVARHGAVVMGDERQGKTPEAMASQLLTLARDRFTGSLRLARDTEWLELTFDNGVVTAAADNLRESLLGERLWRKQRLTAEELRATLARMQERGERLAEAMLALGLCSSQDAIQELDAQFHTRAQRALSFAGEVRVTKGKPAQLVGGEPVDVVDLILGYGLDDRAHAAASMFATAYASVELDRHPQFDAMLASFARVRPDSRLPEYVMSGGKLVVDACVARSSASEVYALHLAQMLRLPFSQMLDPRPVPVVHRASTSTQIDTDAAERVGAALLRLRGRDAYSFFGVSPSTPSSHMLQRLHALNAQVGPIAIGRRPLGPMLPAARELWSALDDLIEVFSSTAARAEYDAKLVGPGVTVAPTRSDAEDYYLRGQVALSAGDVVGAKQLFQVAHDMQPRDAEYCAHYYWTKVLLSDPDGIRGLMVAHRLHPRSFRPLFFLAMAAVRVGERDKARAMLQECARRAPDNAEIAIALATLP